MMKKLKSLVAILGLVGAINTGFALSYPEGNWEYVPSSGNAYVYEYPYSGAGMDSYYTDSSEFGYSNNWFAGATNYNGGVAARDYFSSSSDYVEIY